MRSLNNPIAVLFVTALIAACSCTKRPNDEKKLEIQNPTSYLLRKIIWSGPTSNGESLAFFYNSDHLVSKIERYEWSGGPSQITYDTSYYSFEYTNGLCTKWKVSEGFEGYFIFEYNTRNLPVKRTCYYADNSFSHATFYKYDNDDNLIEKTDSAVTIDFRSVYAYDSNNDLVSSIEYILWSSPQQKVKYEWSNFDQKVNFIKAVNGLPVTAAYDNNVGSYSSSSPNNAQTENYFSRVDINQSFGSPNSSSFSYEYNEQGLPVKMKTGPWIVTFEYEKYK